MWQEALITPTSHPLSNLFAMCLSWNSCCTHTHKQKSENANTNLHEHMSTSSCARAHTHTQTPLLHQHEYCDTFRVLKTYPWVSKRKYPKMGYQNFPISYFCFLLHTFVPISYLWIFLILFEDVFILSNIFHTFFQNFILCPNCFDFYTCVF